jgi:hypothetical protein
MCGLNAAPRTLRIPSWRLVSMLPFSLLQRLGLCRIVNMVFDEKGQAPQRGE